MALPAVMLCWAAFATMRCRRKEPGPLPLSWTASRAATPRFVASSSQAAPAPTRTLPHPTPPPSPASCARPRTACASPTRACSPIGTCRLWGPSWASRRGERAMPLCHHDCYPSAHLLDGVCGLGPVTMSSCDVSSKHDHQPHPQWHPARDGPRRSGPGAGGRGGAPGCLARSGRRRGRERGSPCERGPRAAAPARDGCGCRRRHCGKTRGQRGAAAAELRDAQCSVGGARGGPRQRPRQRHGRPRTRGRPWRSLHPTRDVPRPGPAGRRTHRLSRIR